MTDYLALQEKLNSISVVFSAILILIILFDFCFLGTEHNEKIVTVKTDIQPHYNASRNKHFTYRINTANFSVPVSENFAKLAKEGQLLKFEVSPIFGKVNHYALEGINESSTYSLRLISGLIYPILAGIILFINFRFNRLSNFSFITKFILIVDLVYLLY